MSDPSRLPGREGVPHTPSLTAYTKGCRCDDCRAIKSETEARNRARRLELTRAGSDRVPHGTESGNINWGCNCKACYRAREVAYARRLISKYEGEL